MTANSLKKWESGHETSDGHATGSGTRVITTGHAGPRNGQTNASAIVVTANGHSKSVSAPDGPGSGQKTETAHGQNRSVTSHGESTVVHETANGPWSKSATCETGHVTPETVNGHSDALHENLDLAREMNVKSVSGSGPR